MVELAVLLRRALNAMTTYRPLHLFREAGSSSESGGPCLVLLNQDLHGLETVIREHWSKFSLHVCADGGSNRLYDMAASHRDQYLPHTICGDLDSARDGVLQYYQQRGCHVLKVTNQDTTDFVKTVKEVLALRQRGLASFSAIYAMNAMGGRFDQTLGNVQTVMLLEKELEGTPVYLLSEDSIAAVLRPGESVVTVDSGLERRYCGLLPIGQPCTSCTTTGLQWNLHGQEMRFGELVSTSNLLSGHHPAVHVTTSSSLLWTMSHTLCDRTQ